MGIESTRLYSALETRKSDLTFIIKQLSAKIEPLLTRIPKDFSNYTNHDICHSINVAEYMYDLLPSDVSFYSDSEIFFMLAVALCHDVGMTSSESVVDDNENSNNIVFTEVQQSLKRKIHHVLSYDIIKSLPNDFFKLDLEGNLIVKEEVALLSRSHGENIKWIEENFKNDVIFGTDPVNLQFIAYILRIADLLDFDYTRTPLILEEFIRMPIKSYEEWEKQRGITNKQKIFTENSGYKYIRFDGKCADPNIFRGQCEYFELIEQELNEINACLFTNSKYILLIDSKIKNNIEPVGFKCADMQYKMDYHSISNLLMGENLYPDKKCALRELLQNAIDACLLRSKLEPKLSSYSPQISIVIENDIISIIDNGIGMSEAIINKYFLNIGQSYYSSGEFKESNIDYIPISHYGIGFLASFLLSRELTVITSYWKESQKVIVLKLEKDNRFVVEQEDSCEIPFSGTKIVLNYNDVKTVFPDIKSIQTYISETFLDSGIIIKITENENSNSVNLLSLKSSKSPVIDLSPFLNEVECVFDLTPSGSLIRKNEDFLHEDSEYIYAPDIATLDYFSADELFEYNQIENTDYIRNNLFAVGERLEVLKVYFTNDDVTSYFDECFEILENEEDALDKVDEKYGLDNPLYLYSEESISSYLSNVETINFKYIEDEPSKRKKIFKTVQTLAKNLGYGAKSALLVLDYKTFFMNETNSAEIRKIQINNSYYIHQSSSKIYIRNVNVVDFSITIPYIISGNIYSNFLINIKSRECIPDASRSKLKSLDATKLGYAIGRAIYKQMIDTGKNGNINLTAEEIDFLKDFINRYYPKVDGNPF